MNHGKVSKEITAGLQALKQRIAAAKVPSSKIDEKLNIASWNIREFGKMRHSVAAVHYQAEIIGQFDLVGIVELRDDLTDLGRVLQILGPTRRAVYSDMIPDAGGNRERLGFIFDKRAVTFNGLAAEANPPRTKKGEEYLPGKSFWRSPYLALFKSGNFDFVVLTTYIRWGNSNAARLEEILTLADWIEAKRQEKNSEDKDLIVMGDFNIPSRTDPCSKPSRNMGCKFPRRCSVSSSAATWKNKRYDQILHQPIYPDNFTHAGGVLDFHLDEARINELFPAGMTKEKFTFQLSDLPLRLQINTDIDGFKLDEIIQG